MLDITKVLNRSWHILWKYRILWIFGYFLALAAGGYSGSNFNWSQNYGRRGEMWHWNPGEWGPVFGQRGDDLVRLLIISGIVLVVIVLICIVITSFLKYISLTATIRAVDDYEKTGIKAGFKQLWKTGWNRKAWQLFLIDLLLSLPFIAIVIIEALLGLWVYFATQSGNDTYMVFSIVTAVGLTLLFLLAGFLLAIALTVIEKFAVRVCALEGLGVIDSIKGGYAMIRRHLSQVFYMWLVMIGIGIAWFIVSIFLILPLILVSLILILPAALIGAIPGLIAAGLAALFQMPFPWFWIIGGMFALPLFGLIIAFPSNLISGWAQVFSTSVWTETYRELKTLEVVKTKPALPVQPPKPVRKVVVKPAVITPVKNSKTAVKSTVKKTTTDTGTKSKSLPKK